MEWRVGRIDWRLKGVKSRADQACRRLRKQLDSTPLRSASSVLLLSSGQQCSLFHNDSEDSTETSQLLKPSPATIAPI